MSGMKTSSVSVWAHHTSFVSYQNAAKLARLVPAHDVGGDLAGGKVANLPAKLLLVLRQRKGIGGNGVLFSSR